MDKETKQEFQKIHHSIEKLAISLPSVVVFISGSFPRVPTSITLFADIIYLLINNISSKIILSH